MPDGSFPVEVVEGVPVVAAPEEIDITNAEALRSALLKAAANGNGTLVVDMSQTRFCDSSGLHTLLAAHKRAGAEGRELLLVIPSPAVLRVFVLTAMDQVLPNFASLAEALVAVNGHRNGRVPASELPGTLKRSQTEAQDAFTWALTRAREVYGEGDQALRAAYTDFKRTFEKRGDEWIPKQASSASG
jgi:anti-sigma B factor antagonist